MCYWIGTNNTKKGMSDFVENNPMWNSEIILKLKAFNFQEQYVAIGKGKPNLTVIANSNDGPAPKNMEWTLPYEYTDKEGKHIKRELLNSTCEQVFFQHKDQIFTKRCLVPIQGYFEFYHFGGKTYPHFLRPTDNSIFLAGGIWDQYLDEKTGELKDTFSIITTPPNSTTEKLHNNPKAPNGPRMLLLLEKYSALDYLNPDLKTNEIKEFFKPYEASKMKSYPVIQFLKKENLELLGTERVTEPVAYSELSPGLF
jgi:putative SOS response-associated peptidase YedK